MPGGLLNLVAYGNLNIILNGNPSKTFFKATYAKYTNFGLQKFRIDYNDLRSLRLTDDSTFSFSIPYNGDLLMDTYLSVKLPDIYSPIYGPPDISFVQPYEFKWIENLGSNLLRAVRFMIDGVIIQEFTGQYLQSMVQRDFTEVKKQLFNEMTGNTTELNDPANYSNRNGNYPSASTNNYSINQWSNGVEPSIRGRTIYIPLNIWSTLLSEMALPLLCLQYNKVVIEIVCRPIQDLFVIRDVSWLNNEKDATSGWTTSDRYRYYNPPYIAPDFNDPAHQMFYFLQEPPYNTYYITGTSNDIGADSSDASGRYLNIRDNWHQDIHLVSTYAFIDKEEERFFAGKPQSYLIKQVQEETFYNVLGTQRAQLDNLGLVTSWMWFFQRTDVKRRNEWSNYSNWEYNYMPYPCILSQDISLSNPLTYPPEYPKPCLTNAQTHEYKKMYITGPFHVENAKNIMTDWGLLVDGKVRETIFDVGIVNYTEKYMRTVGNAKSGLYCYNFCLSTDPFATQPSGAMNLSKFTDIEFQYSTIKPYDLSYVQHHNHLLQCDICDNILGVENPNVLDYLYRYNLHIMQEKYNVLIFEGGMAQLMFSR